MTRLLAGLVVVLSLGSVARAAVTISAIRETQKIRPSPAPAAQSSIALSCAGNEFCAFQVAATAAGGASMVTDVTLADLADSCGNTLSGSSALVYREGFMNVTTVSNSDGATGLWPDPLIPKVDTFYSETRNAFPIAVAAGQSQGFWIELLIPPMQAAGLYSGNLSVTADGATQQIAVTIQVRGFSLPSTSSLASAYGFEWDGPCVGHFGGYGGPNCDDQQLEAINALYFQDALNHRITISSLVYADPVADNGGDFTNFDTLYGPFLDGTALSGKNQLAGAKITTLQYNGGQVAASYTTWATHFKAKGWFDRLFDYTCDEPPSGCAWADINTRAAIVHAGDANFRTLTTTSIQQATTNNVLSAIDILVPIINEMFGSANDPYPGSQRANYDAFLQMPNKKLWMYQSCEPSSSCSNGNTTDGETGWPTMFIDESALSNRMMQWMDFKYQVAAELYYDTNYGMAQASQDVWKTQYEFGNNGDGNIWYPGKPSLIGGTHDIPIESIRMKMLREGMQDYEYLNMLTQLGDGAFAQTELGKVVTNAGSFSADPAVLEQTRREMADEIEKDVAATGGGAAACTDGGMVAARDGGGVVTDAGGNPADASIVTDGSAAMDGSGGGHKASSKGGCSCQVGGRAGAAPLGLALILLLGVTMLRRRQRR